MLMIYLSFDLNQFLVHVTFMHIWNVFRLHIGDFFIFRHVYISCCVYNSEQPFLNLWRNTMIKE